MAVSKRLRFEILRRDGFRCRYCGATPIEAELRVDHVIPVALGGTDGPENLATACDPCNTGKSSVHPDSPVVADVARDAERWAAAMKIVAADRAAESLQTAAQHAEIDAEWSSWTFNDSGQSIPRPSDWRSTIDQLLSAGLATRELIDLIAVAMEANARDTWKYFCGCCWTRLRENQARAAQVVETWDALDQIHAEAAV